MKKLVERIFCNLRNLLHLTPPKKNLNIYQLQKKNTHHPNLSHKILSLQNAFFQTLSPNNTTYANLCNILNTTANPHDNEKKEGKSHKKSIEFFEKRISAEDSTTLFLSFIKTALIPPNKSPLYKRPKTKSSLRNKHGQRNLSRLPQQPLSQHLQPHQLLSSSCRPSWQLS